MGYQAIANALGDGVEKGNVRYFCKTRGLVGTPELIKLNYDTHVYVNRKFGQPLIEN